jgi:hypothetical protein
MIHQKIFNIIKESDQIKDFFIDANDVDVLIKKITINELKALYIEYPNLLKIVNNNKIKIKYRSDNNEISPLILCLTFIKRDFNMKNYIKLKKIKLYIDEMNEKIVKILKN